MSMDGRAAVEEFLAGSSFAVVGASRDRRKFGNKVVRCYQQAGRRVFAVNPHAAEVEGLTCFADIGALPETPHGVSIITPPAITERVVEDIVRAGIGHVWMQPGAESERAIAVARTAGLSVIEGGPCVLIVLGFDEAL